MFCSFADFGSWVNVTTRLIHEIYHWKSIGVYIYTHTHIYIHTQMLTCFCGFEIVEIKVKCSNVLKESGLFE